MSFSIDTTSYNKAANYPQRHGYQARGGASPSSIVIHTTSNRRKTAFETEANYLFKSADVSSHYLIAKDGRMIEFLNPVKYQAWHAGKVLPAFSNAQSIGIEHHISVGETWTDAQHAACTWLVRSLMAAYGIPPALVDTHRAVALPKRRKSDPGGWDDSSFYAWRATLNQQIPPDPPRPDPFAQWGDIERPTGDAQKFATPLAWLVNKKLGKCITPETYSLSGKYSIAEFENGIIIFYRERNITQVEMF